MTPAVKRRSMSEAQLQQSIVDLCHWLRLKVFHPYDSRKSVGPGYPDLTIAGPGGVVFAELKNETNSVSRDQRKWIDMLEAAGAEVHVWRPRHLEAIRRRLHELAGRTPGGKA